MAYEFQGVTPDPFVALASVSILATAYLGGIGSVSGAAVAGTLAIGGLSFRLIERYVNVGKFELLISGVGLVLTAVMNPEGIAGVLRTTVNDLKLRFKPRPADAPHAVSGTQDDVVPTRTADARS